MIGSLLAALAGADPAALAAAAKLPDDLATQVGDGGNGEAGAGAVAGCQVPG